MFFNKEGQPSIIEVAKKTKALPDKFPISDFLKLYNEWKDAPPYSSYEVGTARTRQSIFSDLRELHQKYGVNSASTVFGSEDEMHTFAKYLNDIKDNRTETQKNLSDAKNTKQLGSNESIQINGKEIKKGAILLLGDHEVVFTGKYTVDTDGKIIEIEVSMGKSEPGYAKITDITFPNKTGETKDLGASRPPERSKYDLDKSRGYAIQELKKVGKTIRDLKKGLKLTEDDTFDQATLDAVMQYQKDNNLQKVDGLVGPETIGSLWGVTLPIPGATRLPDGTPEPSRRPIVPRAGGSGGITPPVSPASGNPERTTTLSDLNSAMDIFRKTIGAVSQKSGIIFDTPEEIEKYKQSVNSALIKVLPLLKSVESQKLSKTDQVIYDKIVLEIAKYFNNTLDGVKNRHYRNYDLAFDLSLSLIKDDLKKQNITVPVRPSQKEVLQSLKSLDPKLQKKIETDMRAGYDLGQILSNPQVRSQWESVYEKIYSKYEDDMQILLKSLKKNRPTMSSSEGQNALDTMISIMGTKDFWDIKSRNKDFAGQMVGMVGSTLVGIGAVAVTPFTGGTSGILGAALLGGVVTTAGIVATKGRGGADLETATELGINILTIGAGGAIAKGANTLAKGSKLGVTAINAGGGIGVGMTADYIRAWEADTSIPLSTSFRNNLAFALLPLGAGMAWTRANKLAAERLANKMDIAKQQTHNGDLIGAKATMAAAETDVAKLAQQVKQERSAITPPVTSHLPPGGLGIGSKIDPKKTTNTGETPMGINPNTSLNEGATGINQGNLEKAIKHQFGTLKTDGDSAIFGNYTLTKDGKNYRVKQDGEHGGSWIKSKDEVLDMIKSGLKKSDEQAQKTIDISVKEGLKAFPQGKTKTYEWNGEKYTMKKSKTGDDVEVIGKDGKILTGKDLDAFYATQAEQIIDLQKKSFFQAHGEKPIGEALHGKDWYKFTSFEGWKKWHQERSLLNPIKFPAQFARFSAEQIWDSLKAPIKTLDALKQGVMKDHWLGSDGKFNSTAKAIVLRNANQDWFTWQSIGTVAGRGMAIPVAMTIYDVWGQANPALSYSDLNIQWASIFYGGLIWGSLASNTFTDAHIPPNPFASKNKGSEVPAK